MYFLHYRFPCFRFGQKEVTGLEHGTINLYRTMKCDLNLNIKNMKSR